MLILRLLAQQAGGADGRVLKRYDRKPKRLASRKLHILQGFPGIGPQLARRLLARFGSVERVLTADEQALTAVRGMGPRKAERMRALMCDGDLELATLASPQQCTSVSGNNLPRADDAGGRGFESRRHRQHPASQLLAVFS